MADLDRWTSAEFKNAENDLLQKKKRREEIPAEIKNKEQRISECKVQITEAQNTLNELNGQIPMLENQIRNWNTNYQNSFRRNVDEEYARRMDEYRNRIQAQISAAEKKINTIESEQSRCRQAISQNNETIRVLELEISNLKAQDQMIIEKCRDYVNTFREVSSEAEKAVQSHQGAAVQFSQAGTVSRFGRDAIQKGQTKADEKVKIYKDKNSTAIMLMRLATAIIGGNEASTERGSGNVTGGNHSVQNQNVMMMGYGSASSESIPESSAFPRNPDGSTDFTSSSYVGALNYDSSFSSYDLDEFVGKTQYNMSAEQIEQFRRESGIVWHVEGDKVYMIHKSNEAGSSSLGYTLNEWNVDTPTTKPKMKVLKK